MANKIDRIEFSSIIHNKANSHDYQRLLHEILKSKSFEDLQKNERLQNLLSDSVSESEMNCSKFDMTRSSRSIVIANDMIDNLDPNIQLHGQNPFIKDQAK